MMGSLTIIFAFFAFMRGKYEKNIAEICRRFQQLHLFGKNEESACGACVFAYGVTRVTSACTSLSADAAGASLPGARNRPARGRGGRRVRKPAAKRNARLSL
jgi:hypothetical protein